MFKEKAEEERQELRRKMEIGDFGSFRVIAKVPTYRKSLKGMMDEKILEQLKCQSYIESSSRSVQRSQLVLNSLTQQ